MSVGLKSDKLDEILSALGIEYDIYAPVTKEGQGRFSDTDLVCYDKIESIKEIEWNKKSNYSPKELLFPITQRLFYFTKNQQTEAVNNSKKMIVFLRACDINGITRLDDIFLNNGNEKDVYYKRLREKVLFVLMECSTSFENCFCVSMNSNKTDRYSIAIRKNRDEYLLEIKNGKLSKFFADLDQVKFSPRFINKNEVKVTVPNITNMPSDAYTHEMWKDYKSRCIACGRCNTTCITCSCFSVTDIAYEENESVGERRRTWAGCHIDGFSNMAGGHDFRQDNGSRMRFKTFHKVYDFYKRFDKHMCVGCGRCDDNCPEYISFSNCINKLTDIL